MAAALSGGVVAGTTVAAGLVPSATANPKCSPGSRQRHATPPDPQSNPEPALPQGVQPGSGLDPTTPHTAMPLFIDDEDYLVVVGPRVRPVRNINPPALEAYL